jgi:hypothetical protein
MSGPATLPSASGNLPSLESLAALFQTKKTTSTQAETPAPQLTSQPAPQPAAAPQAQQANVPQVDATINTLSQGIFSTLAKIFAVVVIAAYLFSDPQGSSLDRKIGQSLNGLVTGATPVVTHWNEFNTSATQTIQAASSFYTNAKRTVEIVAPLIPAVQNLAQIFSASTARQVTV